MTDEVRQILIALTMVIRSHDKDLEKLTCPDGTKIAKNTERLLDKVEEFLNS